MLKDNPQEFVDSFQSTLELDEVSVSVVGVVEKNN